MDAITATQKYRNDGTTTKQMHTAPFGAVYIWCNQHIDYAEHLARYLGRKDLKIVRPSWLTEHGWAGGSFSGIVLDHATRLTEMEYAYLGVALRLVRS